MEPFEVFFGLLLVALFIAVIAKRKDLPYPIALLLGGVVLALVSDLPPIELDPEIVFFLLLPPILFEAAYFTSWRDFWRLKRPIFLLAFGLVAATSAVVALLCKWLIPGMSWATGFVLGAIVSPPDAAAATAITRGMKLPRRVVQILEGESLVNDAAGLTVYRFAVLAVVTGSLSLGHAALTFAWIAVGGVLVGIALGFGYVKLLPKIRDVEVEIISTFLLAYGSYFLAEQIEASGVLSTVTAGLIFGWHAPELFNSTRRLRGAAVWQTAIFLINVIIFLLIGLQLPIVLKSLQDYPVEWLIWWSAAISAGVIAVRLLWVFPGAYIPRMLFKSIREKEPKPSQRLILVVGWTGLRGVVSLAAALGLPEETREDFPFPYRNLVQLLTFAVIFVTLTLQGLTLKPLIRWLRIPADRSSEEEELNARIFATERAVAYLTDLEEQGQGFGPGFNRVKEYYQERLADFLTERETATGEGPPERPEEFQSLKEQRLWWELVRIERQAVIELRRARTIGDEALHQIERDIDLLEERLIPKASS